MTKQLRWGVLGCANIAVKSVIPGIKQSERGVVAAIASRDESKARKTADQLGIEKAYGSYEALLEDPDIDAVYVPLPNHLHKEWTIKAARAKKHVLCEKPIALTAKEAEEMVQACREEGVHLAEAFMYRHHPRYDLLMDIIQSGEIGTIRGIRGVFTFNNASAKDNVRFYRSMGGGSIYDIGCYPISAARLIMQKEPEAATVRAFFSPDHDYVDMMAAGLIEFEGDVALTFDCAMWAAGRNELEILGTDGRIEFPSAFVSHQNENDHFFVTSRNGKRKVEVPMVNQYALQADDFAAVVLDGKEPKFAPEDAVHNMRVIDACLASAKRKERVLIGT